MKLNYLTLILNVSTIPFADAYVLSAEEFPNFSQRDAREYGNRLYMESAYITEYIMRAANQEFNFDCSRINLVCTNQKCRNVIRKYGSVHDVDIPFDFKYFSFSPKEKEQYLYEIVSNGLRILCQLKGWNYSLFEKHLISLRDNDFKVEFHLEKKVSRNGGTTAKIFCFQTMTEATFYVDFFRGQRLIQRKFLMITEPDAMCYRFEIDHLRWENDTTVGIYNFNNIQTTCVTMN